MATITVDGRLRRALSDLPNEFHNRYTDAAHRRLLDILFRSLTDDNPQHFAELFPDGYPSSHSLQDAQGAQEEPEYTEAARGHPCGHILRNGEATYKCTTCSDDPTVVLCVRCWAASDHDGHQFDIQLSSGNSGCCDCGDVEAFKRPVRCAIHDQHDQHNTNGEENTESTVPQDLQGSARRTIARVLDYFCDVISCSPENLRVLKTEAQVIEDEKRSRLDPSVYTTTQETHSPTEYNLLIWNDEKHTMEEVQDQVARACRERRQFGTLKAEEAHDVGRSVVCYSTDLPMLLARAKIMEDIKVTVTVRAARDTFREQMCAAIVDWLRDITGCTFAGSSMFLRNVICEEMLQLWQIGSQAYNAQIGREGFKDHAVEDPTAGARYYPDAIHLFMQRNNQVIMTMMGDDDDDSEADDLDVVLDDPRAMLEDSDMGSVDIPNTTQDDDADMPDGMVLVDQTDGNSQNVDIISITDEMDTDGDGEFADAAERIHSAEISETDAGRLGQPSQLSQLISEEERASTQALLRQNKSVNYRNVPRTPGVQIEPHRKDPIANSSHWKTQPESKGKMSLNSIPVWDDIRNNIRLDSLILFDLRLWKRVRIALRDLLISTMIKVPVFKRILGLRFAGVYTTLAQSYLIADREPDHSIVHLSVQVLTTPSIAEEVMQKANFLTNLMAILYTFLTTRQVGYPEDVDTDASLGFDAGTVGNRRLYQFFTDLRYFLAIPSIKTHVKTEKQYLLQYLDLARLSQGICPNVRAVGEHVEYETDAWISASLLTREINKLCRQLTEAYTVTDTGNGFDVDLADAIRQTAIVTLLVSSGLDYQRYEQSEIKGRIKFHHIEPAGVGSMTFKTIDFVPEDGALSFHHPLHYTLSWLLECGKGSAEVISVLRDTASELVSRFNAREKREDRIPLHTLYVDGEDALIALFDYPLRVCAWLAQMKANMWVRNGMSLRHQMNQYKGVIHRDVGHQRDIFLLQTAFVTCDPERMLASMIDRFGLVPWVSGQFQSDLETDKIQLVEVAEDLIHLLINILSDRDNLSSSTNDPDSQIGILRRDIAHTLCFKPLSYSDLVNRLTEKAQDSDQLQSLLESMTTFKAPEGLSDSGVFELKPEYLRELDPYNSHFTKNQRDEAENVYKTWMARKLNKQPEDIVLEPKLHEIKSAAYRPLCRVIHTPLFATCISTTFTQLLRKNAETALIPSSRAESFLQVTLHLVLIATIEDTSLETTKDTPQRHFIQNALELRPAADQWSIVEALHQLWLTEEFSACRSKVRHILKIFHNQWPDLFTRTTAHLDFSDARLDASSPASLDADIEAKKKQATERKARIMAQMQQQQQSFLSNQGISDWDDDEMSDAESELPTSSERRTWKMPSGVCIQCREETNDSRVYGTFAMVTDGHLLRITPSADEDYIREIQDCPDNMDESIENQRPFGVAGANIEQVRQLSADGSLTMNARRSLSKGWPKGSTLKEPVSNSCGHIMHYNCFENYYASVRRRHDHQIARRQPERVSQNEFVCPLCKALANVFLPVVYKSSEQCYPGNLYSDSSFEMFVDETLPATWISFEALDSEARLSDHLIDLENTVYLETPSTFTTNAGLAIARARAEAKKDQDAPVDMAVKQALADLANIYKRLRETLEFASFGYQRKDTSIAQSLTMLLKVVTHSVTAVEIGQRGRVSTGLTLLDGISSHVLSHLQVLSHTLIPYAATTVVVGRSESTDYPLQHLIRGMAYKLFPNSFKQTGQPLLNCDGFETFVEQSVVLARVQGIPIHHILRLCLTQELIRVAIWWLRIRSVGQNNPAEAARPRGNCSLSTDNYRIMGGFVFWLASVLPGSTALQLPTTQEVKPLFKALQTYALAFMRKATIFLHVAHGVDYPLLTTMTDKPELERLLNLNRLPSLTAILSEFSEFTEASSLPKLVSTWISHWGWWSGNSKDSIQLLHPAPFELIGLPQYYDVLLEECQKRKCPTTGKALTDPALCLFCGEIFCSQAWCCMVDKYRGGCNHHIQNCSAPVGAYLFIRKCNIVLLDVKQQPRRHLRPGEGGGDEEVPNAHGSFFPAPYLTKHGETDQGLRTKHQLILNQKRYDKLVRDVWLMLNGNIWSAIARKLEGDVNAGGWETL